MKFPVFLLIAFSVVALSSFATPAETLRFGSWDYDWMCKVKSSIEKSDQSYMPAYRQLLADANRVLQGPAYSVIFKKTVPPSGSKNDYMSIAPYWWPDSTKTGGIPYVRHDGARNPEVVRFDRPQLDSMVNSVRLLSLAWFFSNQTNYSKKAAQLLKVWFLDPKTRMNPHLEYGQAIPGHTPGRGIGIIETRNFTVLVDAITLLGSSDELSKGEKQAIKEWFKQYFTWLTQSRHGKDENSQQNNHSVAYDLQTSAIAYFLGDDAFVVKKIGDMRSMRIDSMIEADGRQPKELSRALAFGYAEYNLDNFFDAGVLGSRVGIDLFRYVNPKGGSLLKALDFLSDYIGREKDWPYQQFEGTFFAWNQTEDNLGLLLMKAGQFYEEYKQPKWKEIFSNRLKNNYNLLVIQGW